MKCEICKRDFINLGVHLRHKHQVLLDDYKSEFGLLKTMPLVDKDLSNKLSKAMKYRMLDEEFLAEKIQTCKENGAKLRGGKGSQNMSAAGKKLLASRNNSANEAYLKSIAPKVLEILSAGLSINDVLKLTGSNSSAVKKIITMSGFFYDKKLIQKKRSEKAAISLKKRKISE